MSFEDLHRPLTAGGFRGAVRWIIIVTGLFLVAQQFYGGPLIYYLGLTPPKIWRAHWWWQIFSYMLLDRGWFIWLFNMFIIWMFGRELEVRWGTFYFVKFCLVAGFGSGLCVLLLAPHSLSPVLGTAGVAFGILAAFAMVFPEAVLYLYFLVPVKAWQAAIFFGAIELLACLSAPGDALARVGNLGGMLTGYVYLKYGWQAAFRAQRPLMKVKDYLARLLPRSKRRVEFHEMTDDLAEEVDAILDKILRNGADSLTSRERRIMERYSQLKR